MREIVHIQAGQCGNQIGAKVSSSDIYLFYECYDIFLACVLSAFYLNLCAKRCQRSVPFLRHLINVSRVRLFCAPANKITSVLPDSCLRWTRRAAHRKKTKKNY